MHMALQVCSSITWTLHLHTFKAVTLLWHSKPEVLNCMPLSFQRVKSTIFLPIGGKPSFYSLHVEPAIGLCVCNNSLCHNLFSPIQSLQSLLTATFQHTMKPKITLPVTSPLMLMSVVAYFGGHFLHMQQKLQKKFFEGKMSMLDLSISILLCSVAQLTEK